jgi:hypothetical protein
MKPWGVAGIVDHRAADSAPGVVLPKLDRVGPTDDPFLGPVQRVATGLVGYPVLVGVPERASLDDHHPPTVPGQPLGQHRSTRASPDDNQVDLVIVAVSSHGGLAR